MIDPSRHAVLWLLIFFVLATAATRTATRYIRHRADQAEDYIAGRYRPQHLDDGDIRTHTRSTLRLLP